MDQSTHPLTRWWVIQVPRRSARWWAVVGVAYIVLTVLWTWPLARHFTDAAIQGVAAVTEKPVDTAQNTWNIWHFRLHWADGTWPLSTERIFYPQRLNLTFQTYGLPNLLIAAPLAALIGDMAAMNVLVVLGFVVAALGMNALLRAYGVSDGLAFGLGWLFVASPAHLSVVQTSGIERAMMGWLLLVHWAIARMVRQPGWRSALVLAGALLVASLNSGYYGLYGLVYCGVLAVAALRDAQIRQRWVQTFGWFGSGVAVWAVVMAVLLSWPPSGYLGQRTTSAQTLVGPSVALDDWYMRQTDPMHVMSLADIITPPSEHLWWWLLGVTEQYPHPGVGGYLGFGVVLLLLWGYWYERRIRLLVVVTGVLIWLACGPAVRLWEGQSEGILPGLYALLNSVSVYKNATRPGMFLFYAWIPLTVVLAATLQRISIRSMRLALVLVVVLVVDFWPPVWGLVRHQPSLAVPLIPKDEPAGAVLEVPARMDEGQVLLDQMCHGRPLAAGYLARVPDFYVTPMHGIVAPPKATVDVIPSHPMREMGNLGVRYLIVHHDAPNFVLANLIAWEVPLLAKVERERVFRVPAPTEASLVAAKNWWDSEDNGTQRWRWSQAESRLIILSERPKIVRIAMTMSSIAPVTAQWRLNGTDVFAHDVPAQPQMLSRVVSLPIAAGVNYLDVRSATTTDEYGRAVGIAFTQLEIVGSSEVSGGVTMVIPATDRDTPLCP
ncbi:MAG: hypothetical protein ACK5S9_09435 [Roseiflexaceae bacterium]